MRQACRGNRSRMAGWQSKKILSLKGGYLSKPFSDFWLLQTDSTPLLRPHSPTLPARRYVYKPNNQVKSNKPVDLGYECSVVGLSARCPRYGVSEGPWSLPLSMRLIPYEQNRNSFTARQVNDLLDNPDLPFGTELSVNALDSNYSAPEYITDTHHQPHLVNIIRLASNRNVWKRLTGNQQQQCRESRSDSRGAQAIYGPKYKLSEADQWQLPPDQQEQFGIQLANGRKTIVKMAIWEEMMFRSKRGKSMKDKPFRLAQIELLDPQTEQPIFKKKMWLGIWGERKEQLTGEQIFWAYRNRFDIEHFFRFGKQRLLPDQFQTPDEEHWQNWIEVVSLAYWLLWVASEQATHQPTKKWQQYDKYRKLREQFHLRPSPSQVQQQLLGIILGFDQEPFLPKTAKKGKGRKTGTKFPPRQRYPIRKKTYKKKKSPT